MTNFDASGIVLAVSGLALYAAHHVGDYWVQTDHQARHKGDPDRTGRGRAACLAHVLTYVLTQNVFLAAALAVAGLLDEVNSWGNAWAWIGALAVSGVTHYWADRRWTLEWLIRTMRRISPNKIRFYRLGAPRPLRLMAAHVDSERDADWAPLDNPCLGTGAWALDQSFHIVFSVFVPALILAASA